MVDFVAELAEIARRRSPNFIVVPQNAEELLPVPRYLAATDVIAKEDLLFGVPNTGVSNSFQHVTNKLKLFSIARNVGVPVVVVEYLEDEAKRRNAAEPIRSFGFVPYIGVSKLDRLVAQPEKK